MKFYLSLLLSFFLGVTLCYSYFTFKHTRSLAEPSVQSPPQMTYKQDDTSPVSQLIEFEQPEPRINQPVTRDIALAAELDDTTHMSNNHKTTVDEQRTDAAAELDFSAIDTHFQSLEFAKAAATIEANFALSEINHTLSLNEQQLSALSTLLHEKNNAEIELMTPYYQRMASNNNPFLSPEQDQSELDAINLERDAIQSQFEQKLTQHLSAAQIDSYHDLEKQKIVQQHELDKFYSTQSYFAMLPDLQDSQKQVILDIYQQSYQQNMANVAVKLGAFGTAHRQFYQGEHPMQAVEAQIDQILTPEQLAKKKQFEELGAGY